jgi:hypothetical protein
LTRSRRCRRKSPGRLKIFSTVPPGWDTPFTRRSRPPSHGFTGPPHRATPRSSARARHREVKRPTGSPRRRCLSPISATDQLSRAPAGSLDSRACGFHRSDRALSAPPHRSPHRRVGDETEPSATAPASPCGHHQPRVLTEFEELRHQLRSWSPAPVGVSRLSRARARAGFFGRTRAAVTFAMTIPCRTHRRPGQHQARAASTENLFPAPRS